MATETERMLAGDPYDPSAPELVADRARARDLARRYNATSEAAATHRETLLRRLFDEVGDDPVVHPTFRCDYGYTVTVGNGFFANYGCVFLDANTIRFGDRCLLGPGVQVYTSTHPLDPAERAAGRERAEPVTVGDDVWVGGNAVLNPGVTVGDGAVIGSGAVVTGDVPDRVVVAGSPARAIRDIE
jgi:maltose O-acetyltransferase